jgi:mRNA interferase RelE/StbE
MPLETQRRIVIALRRLALTPRPPGVVKMQGEDNLWRIRVGDYRIAYEIQDTQVLILVLRIGHRKDIYR